MNVVARVMASVAIDPIQIQISIRCSIDGAHRFAWWLDVASVCLDRHEVGGVVVGQRESDDKKVKYGAPNNEICTCSHCEGRQLVIYVLGMAAAWWLRLLVLQIAVTCRLGDHNAKVCGKFLWRQNSITISIQLSVYKPGKLLSRNVVGQILVDIQECTLSKRLANIISWQRLVRETVAHDSQQCCNHQDGLQQFGDKTVCEVRPSLNLRAHLWRWHHPHQNRSC